METLGEHETRFPVAVVEVGDRDPFTARRVQEMPAREIHPDVADPFAALTEEDQIPGLEVLGGYGVQGTQPALRGRVARQGNTEHVGIHFLNQGRAVDAGRAIPPQPVADSKKLADFIFNVIRQGWGNLCCYGLGLGDCFRGDYRFGSIFGFTLRDGGGLAF